MKHVFSKAKSKEPEAKSKEVEEGLELKNNLLRGKVSHLEEVIATLRGELRAERLRADNLDREVWSCRDRSNKRGEQAERLIKLYELVKTILPLATYRYVPDHEYKDAHRGTIWAAGCEHAPLVTNGNDAVDTFEKVVKLLGLG